jgi:inner membrane protein
VASAFSHAVAAIGIGTILLPTGTPRRVWIAGALAAAAPDLDVLGFWAGVPYGSPWGHRGLTHSLAAAVVAGTLLALGPWWRASHVTRVRLAMFFVLAIASHGLLDAFTDGGGGVAFFAPFNEQRWFFPWRPIHVSPLSVSRFLSMRGMRILANEFLWIWCPTAVVASLALLIRHRTTRETGVMTA